MSATGIRSENSGQLSRLTMIAVITGGAIMGITIGVRQVFGLFVFPISMDLGVGREVFAFGMGMMNLVWGLASPLAGAVADRYGAGRVAAIGGASYAMGLVAMTWSGDGDQLVIGGVLVGMGLSCAGFTVVLGAVGRAAPTDKQTMALGLASMGGSIGQFAALPFAHVLIESVGWSASLMILAILTMAVVPLAFGIKGKTERPTLDTSQTLREAIREACGHQGFWLLTAGFFVCGFHLAFVAVHLPAYLGDKGMPAWLAAATLTLVGVCNIVGTYLCGYLGQH